MAISKNSKTTSGPATKAKAAGARKHAASADQPNRSRGSTAGTAKSVAGRPATDKKAAHRPPHEPPAGDGRERREHLVVSVLPPNNKQLREVEELINRGASVTIVQGKSSVKVTGNTLAALRQIIATLGAGPLRMIVDESQDPEISSQEAADLLNVSRPYVIKIAREGQLAHRLVGNRHRFLLSDVEAFRQAQRRISERALAAIVPEGGYVDGDF
ncbi:helix-turn-helix domain-containing protein [Kribbella ginsengisoli]|uniref:Helix-turn-helix domain-containing protein n=1 Tax=Kribbella ginsengisoli TaxID=363865 RepID=A0ABP6XEZ6_9ACTN